MRKTSYKNVKRIGNHVFYSAEEVFKKDMRSPAFRKAYNEEMARLKLASQIRELRLAKRLTQKAMAKKADMPQSVLARIESGTHSYSLGTLYRIAHAVNKEIQLV